MWKYRRRLPLEVKKKSMNHAEVVHREGWLSSSTSHVIFMCHWICLNACSRVVNTYRIRQNIKMTHKINYLSSGAYVSNHRISPHISAVAKCVLPLRELCMSVIRSDVIYYEPFPDAQDGMSGNELHISTTLKLWQCARSAANSARCDDTQVSVTKSYLLRYCLK